MTIQIANILIWQKNWKLRNLKLERDAVNVITGDSGKGKSSIIHIIDYCLLSSNANGISKSNIDDKSSWYGVRIYTTRGIVTIARPAYHCRETSLVYFDDAGELPNVPTLNMKVESLKKILDKEFGLNSDLKIPYGGKTIKAGSKVTFRNFLSYSYQDQTAMVAPDHLYIKPGDLKFNERIERTFRMAVGLVDAEGAILHERLKKLQADRISLERRSEIIKNKRLEFQEDITSLESEAIALGLLQDSNEDIEISLGLLIEIAESPVIRFSELDEHKKRLEFKLTQIKRQLHQLNSFNEGYQEYQSMLKQANESIKPVTYLLERYDKILPGTNAIKLLQALEEELISVKKSWKNRNESLLHVEVNEKNTALNRELEEVYSKISTFDQITSNMSSLEDVYRYQGRLQTKLEFYSDRSTPIDYSDALSKNEKQISDIESRVEDLNTKYTFIMGKLNDRINDHLSRMPLKGYEKFEAIFSEKKKSISLIIDDGKTVEKMVDIGSASNYLYIHLAYFMSLHEVARYNQVPWMPRFLIFDQVSTPYSGETIDDIKSLDTALKEINLFVREMQGKGGVQVILLEHIPEKHWVNLKLENFKLVDKELTGDYGLIV